MSLVENMPHLCTISRRVRTNDVLGGSSDAITIEQTDVPCWEQAAGDNEIISFDKRGMTIDRKVYFSTNPGLTSRHIITITERNGVEVATASQVQLDVKSVAGPDSGAGLGVLFRAMCNELTGSFE